MSDLIEPGDYVKHPTKKGVRGLVLWVDRAHYQWNPDTTDWVHICWETGYEGESTHDIKELEKINVLDLIVDGRELEFRQEGVNSRCKCGAKMNEMSHGRMYCQRCRKEVKG